MMELPSQLLKSNHKGKENREEFKSKLFIYVFTPFGVMFYGYHKMKLL